MRCFWCYEHFRLDYEQEHEKPAYDTSNMTDASASSLEEQPPEVLLMLMLNQQQHRAQNHGPSRPVTNMLDGYGEVIDILSAGVPVV